MQFVLFSKHWTGHSVDEMIQRTQRIGADGLDLAVRPGQAVNPDNVAEALPETARKLRDAGLALPMISTDTKFVDPNSAAAERLAAAMQTAGVPLAKLGYFQWKREQTPYWKTVDRIRTAFEGFQRLAQRFDIAFCYHTHSDFFGLNAAALMDLLEGFDPTFLGAYLDTAHLHYCGEPFPMAVDIVGAERIRMVSLKDTFFREVGRRDDDTPLWKRVIVPAGHGVVAWDAVFGTLRTIDYDGACSVHCEFAAENDEEFLRGQTREVAFLREQYARTEP